MTRDTKTVSAVFMAVLLVLASGTAVSLAVTDGGSSAVGSNAAAQETTDVGQETTEAGNQETTEVVDEETTEAEDGNGAAAESANVTINDQQSDGERIVIEEVTMEEGGFVAIHDETLLEGDAIGSVVGTSVYLEEGTHQNVIVTLGRPISESQTLIAMPHRDTNDNQVYDFVISGGEADGPYAATDSGAVVDQANVTIGDAQAETTTEDEVAETTTEDEGDDVETTTEDEGVETTTEDDVVQETDVIETTTEVDDVVETTTEGAGDVAETTTEDEVVEETTTEEDEVEETTTEEDEVVETTTEEDEIEETTTETEAEAPAGQQQFIFKVEQMNIDRWSFVVGDEETPDRTETVSDITVQDRRVEINLTELLQNQSQMPADQITTQDPEQVQEQVEDNLSGDIQTVRFVIENVNIENVTFVITAPENMELPEAPQDMGPEMTTEEDDDELEETTTEEDEVIETTTEEVDDVETTTEEVDDVETTTEAEVEETTEVEAVETTEVDDVETTEEDEVEETTTEDVEDVETTTEDEVVETTTEEVDGVETTTAADEGELESFDVSALNAPQSADVGDTINVSAVVENPNDVEATQDVAFRLEGTVVAREEVTLNASGSTTVEFQVDTTDVPPGEYVHGIYTRDFGELAVVTLNEPSAEETDGAAETETEVAGNETELPDDEATTVAVETTTEEA